MRVHKSDIPQEGIEVRMPSIATLFNDVEMEGEGIVLLRGEGRLHLTWNGYAVTVEGRLEGDMEVACARCLDAVRIPLSDDFRVYLREALSAEEVETLAGQENDIENLDYSFLEEGGFETNALLKEEILLRVPARILCREDCRGFCQQCGNNLNHQDCACREEEKVSPFAVLRTLKQSR